MEKCKANVPYVILNTKNWLKTVQNCVFATCTMNLQMEPVRATQTYYKNEVGFLDNWIAKNTIKIKQSQFCQRNEIILEHFLNHVKLLRMINNKTIIVNCKLNYLLY
jgi:hypothetical protein